MSETGPQNQPDDALVDLLVKQVTEGLTPAEQRALEAMDSAVAGDYARDLERAAAAIVLAGTPEAEPPPAALRARIEAQALAFVGYAAKPKLPARAASRGVLAVDDRITVIRSPICPRHEIRFAEKTGNERCRRVQIDVRR